MEVLVSCMNKDEQLVKKMNIQTDAIVVNQVLEEDYHLKEFYHNENHIRMFSMKEKGVGRSRNNALMRADGEIVITADEDEVFVDNYQDIIEKAYRKYPDADMILFEVEIVTSDGVKTKISKEGKVHFFNYFKYGTVNFTFKKDSIYKSNIFFSLLFGGGAAFQSGEDTLFLTDILKKRLKVYSYPEKIATVYNYDSTWFKGYDEEYLKHRGALFRAMSGLFFHLLVIQFSLRKKNLFPNVSLLKMIKLMNEGRKEYLNYKVGTKYGK